MQPRPQRGGRAPHIVEFNIVQFGFLHQFIFDVRHVKHFCQNVTGFFQVNFPNLFQHLIQVYLVYHPYSNIGVVAAKVIRNEDFNEQEWNIAGIFEQDPPQMRPFVIHYILAKQFEKHTVILMDYCNISNLFDIIKTNIDLSISTIRVIMKQLLEGIRYIHSKNLIHRDIKGGNIMLHCQPGSGRVNLKITDFGVVKVNSGDEKTMQMTAIGTEPYMAPEFVLGNGEEQVRADSKVDIWSLGILFFKLASHRFPCGQLNIQSIITFMNKYSQTKVLDRPQNIKNDLLWDLLVKMLQFDRKDRISAQIALQHPFFTGEQAMREIASEQIQLSQTAEQAKQKGDQNISQFETNPSFIFPLTE
ncbi:MAG: putative MAP kinase kinase family domain protein, partial [Streblomastix strix]